MYRAADPELEQSYRNKPSTKLRNKQYYAKNSEKINAYSRQWSKANPEKRKVSKALYVKTHPEQKLAEVHRRRTAFLEAGPLTAETILEVKDRDGEFCCYCLLPKDTELEHCTPLTRGGTNQDNNLAMACVRCNRSKGNRTVLEYCFNLPKLV